MTRGEIALPGDCLLRKRGRAMLVPTVETESVPVAAHSVRHDADKSERSVP